MVRFMETTALARHLLDVQAAYMRYDDDEATLADFGMKPERSRDELAQDYAETLQRLVRP